MSIQDRFYELAHKTLLKRALPAEEAELQALIAGDRVLKNRMEELGLAMRELDDLLVLLKDVENLSPPPFPMLVKRLHEKVSDRYEECRAKRLHDQVSERYAERQVGTLLHELSELAPKLTGTQRERLVEMLSAIRQWVHSPLTWRAPVELTPEFRRWFARELKSIDQQLEYLLRVAGEPNEEILRGQVERITAGCREELARLSATLKTLE